MELVFSPEQIVTGLVGLGLVINGFLEHMRKKAKDSPDCPQSFECKADHSGLTLELKDLGRKLDLLISMQRSDNNRKDA